MSRVWSSVVIILLGICVGVLQSCQLAGDLCLWNSYGFSKKNISDEQDKVLYSKVNNSYIMSLTYENNTATSCQLSVSHSPFSEDSAQVCVYMIFNRTDVELLSTLDTNTSHSLVPISKTNRRFQLMVKYVTFQEKSDLHIHSLGLYQCTPKDKKPFSSSCQVVNNTMCDGWVATHDNPSYSFIAQGDHLTLNASMSQYMQKAILTSPIFPYQANSECKVTLSYRIRGFTLLKSYQIPVIQLDLYDPNFEEPVTTDRILITKKEVWMDWSFPLQNLKDRFFIKLWSKSRGNRTGWYEIANISISDECFPQLPLRVGPALDLDGVEALSGADIVYAEGVTVANRSTSYWFTTCDSTGRTGPTKIQCQEYYPKYRQPVVEVQVDDDALPGVQVWNVPETRRYNIILYGATGGSGIHSKGMAGVIRGTGYVSKNIFSLPSWPSRMHIQIDLVKNEKLYIVVGQAGSMACEQNSLGDCNNENLTTRFGGGGGGGGASIVSLKRNDTLHLLAVAGGGGGMGRMDMPLKFKSGRLLSTYLKKECVNKTCNNNSTVRPGFGGSYDITKQKLIRQDGLGLYWLASQRSLLGGKGCEKYGDQFETHGGFGGGGGGCTAGGGGGGYNGGNISLADNETVPGEQGSSYYNRELTENIQFDLYDPYSVHHPDGWVEIMEVPPDCVCSENRNCKWDDGTYTTHQCQCGGRWMAGSELEACRQSESMKPEENPTRHHVIYGIFGGVVAVLMIFVLTCFLKWRSLQRKKPNIVRLESNSDYGVCEEKLTRFPEERVKRVRTLGTGQFGQVFLAHLTLGEKWNSKEITVAIKTPNPQKRTKYTRSEYIQEALTINALDHPNILKLLGICEMDNGDIGIIMNLFRGGDLKNFLRNNQTTNKNSDCDLKFGDLIRICTDVASACKYLEEMRFIHRDIACRNVLLTELGEKRVAKLSDFGLSKDIKDGTYYCHQIGGMTRPVPVRWYPPESVESGKMTTKSDVWSFGILLWEVFTLGEQPYPQVADNKELATMIKNGLTMSPPATCPIPVGEMMKKCWKRNLDERPSFAFMHLQLTRIGQNKEMMASAVTESTHLRLPSVTSSNSSGFDEMLESPSCLSLRPLINDNGYPNEEMED